ncbi:SurA N-terminal domain-containing protein [Halorhodospira neutriphila]|uniref:Periplasmic chaperone PpiD n=1 Tax=Halorhodospira neutriphila TaxID=168379 RepID=A0ABS1E4M6_9GAMM|nr:SurA N-terminal domain-containing protein [Halorhodospira neutriphila]MBK1726693.1 hypothetical protein [Halorhodospira neutriphila]
MLQSIRDGIKGWVAWLIVALIALPFLFMGGAEYFRGGGGEAVVAKVGDQEIQRRQLEQAVQRQRARLREMFGGELPEGSFDEAALRRGALDQLIDRTLLYDYVERQGLRVSDQAVAREIRGQGLFQQDGAFSEERYRSLLQRNGMAPADYEALVRRDLLVGQLQQGVQASGLATPARLERIVRLRDEARSFSYAEVPASAMREGVSVDEAAVEAYYREHPLEYMTPEAVRLRYVELRLEDLRDEAQIDEQALRERYEQSRGAYADGGRRRVRHILLPLDEDAGAARAEQVRAEIARLRERLRSGGASFAELAEAYSEDPGSAQEGGKLGWISRGEMVEPFEEAAFSLEEGAVSEPVRTRFGYHLIRVDETERGEAQSFAAVRDEIEAELLRERVGDQFAERRNELANRAFEQPESLEPAAEALGLTVQTSGWIPRGGGEEGLARFPAVVEAAFSEEVLEQGYNSELVELGEERFAVVRVAERRPPAPRPLAAVADRIREALRDQRAAERARERAEQLREAVAQGQGLEEAVAESAARLHTAEQVRRRDQGPPAPVRRAAFEMGVGQVRLVELRDGSAALVRLEGVEPGDWEALAEQEREQLRQQVRAMAGRSELQALIRALRADAEVQIHDERL